MYGNICYTMTIFNMFSHLFLTKQSLELSSSMKKEEEEFKKFGEMKETNEECSLFDYETNRPMKN